ncbi:MULTISPECIES: DNA-processing protein DprA [unclassified Luteococcus]|uniref:DNA-processing protein DprA n=1 Tax=unclassified Luteococcus TaxID=2639923 RepID=UPI00313D2110
MNTGWTEERLARAGLTMACEAGAWQLADRVREHGAAEVWETLRTGALEGRWATRARQLDLPAELALAQRHGVRFIIPGDDEWPAALDVLDGVQHQGLGGMPHGLWLRGPGNLARWCERAVAIVGSRASTQYGDHVATDLAMGLAEAGQGHAPWTIVSGGAHGIDGSAHRGAIAAPGRTVAVLACGLDEPYPRGNQVLFDKLAAEQLLVSEVPCGLRPTRVAFLARNRLIAALAGGSIVVEAAARSGANNTASWANACRRVVMAVPGSVRSSLSVTPHRLVRDGEATLVTDVNDVLALVEPLVSAPMLPVGGPRRPLDDLEPDLLQVREALPARDGISAGQVARLTGLGMATVLARLSRLEEAGLARRDELGCWRIATPRNRVA